MCVKKIDSLLSSSRPEESRVCFLKYVLPSATRSKVDSEA